MPTKSEFTWNPELIPQGEISSFHIQSEADPDTFYVVDLLAYDGHGACTCEDYETRIEPSRKAGLNPIKPKCKHIRRAQEHVGAELMAHLSLRARQPSAPAFTTIVRRERP